MKINISITNLDELKHFEKMLPFYRSFLCHGIYFTYSHSVLPISHFIEALNIKNKKQRIIYLYDTLCQQIDTFYADKSLCDFQHDRCISQRKKMKYKNGCCRLCKYASPKGCTTSNFTCKMFYCFTVKEKNRTLSPTDLPLLKCFSIRQRFLLRYEYFSSREDIITDLWIESLFVNLFRVYPRFISNIILQRH